VTADSLQVRAKAVLGRDLRELQARRNQLENPILQQAEIAGPLADGGEPRDASSLHATGTAVPEATVEASEGIKKEDSIAENPEAMDISPPKPELNKISGSPSQTLQAHKEVESQESIQKSMEAPAGTVQTEIDDLSNARDNVDADTNHGPGITVSDAVPSAASEAPVTAGLQDATFDSLFDGDNGESDLNFDDFNFSGDGTGNQNDDFGGSGGGFDLSSFGNQTNNDSGDPNSILQGLESFGDGSGAEFNLLDMSNTATDNQGAGDNAGDDYGMSGGDLDMALGMGANESTFDDLLEGMDFGDGDDGTGGDMMEHGEFDDEFFGLNNDG
jgi:hypothetical protein